MIKRNKITWKYFKFDLSIVANAGIITDIENFEAKQKEVGDENTKLLLESFKRKIESAQKISHNYDSTDDEELKSLYEGMLKPRLESAISDYRELELELFGIKEDDKVWPNRSRS